MVPKERVDSTNQKRLPANAHAHRDVFQARPAMARDGEVKQMHHFCQRDTLCHRRLPTLTFPTSFS